MANRGYDVVVDVDVDQEVRLLCNPTYSSIGSSKLTHSSHQGDLGHTDLQEDLEFHPSNFDSTTPNSRNKIQPDNTSTSGSFLPGPTAASSSRKHYLWSLSFYQQAFDVDTAEVLRRCTATLYPRQNFLDVLEGNPDLYGPVWIATTVVVILFLTGTISQYLNHQGRDHFAYDFKLLSGGAGLIYGYTALVPVALWGVLKWCGSESANLLECACLYGYANLVWIVVALVSWSPLTSESPHFPVPFSSPSPSHV